MAIKPEGLRQINASALIDRIESAHRANAAREQSISQGDEATSQDEFDSHGTINPSNISTVHEQMARLNERDKALSLVRNAPKGDDQADFFVPGLFDVGGRDTRLIMDVAPFRLSKRDKRAGEIIRHELPDGYVEVKAGPGGMASVWDYDIVLMMISHLTEAMNRWRDGKGEKPCRTFTPHVSDILKFARRGDGSRQVEELEAALDRLKGTTIKTVRDRQTSDGKTMREVEAEGLISSYRVVSRTDTNKLSIIEIEAPKWIYREIVEVKSPDVLTVHPDYFLIDPGIGRFLYRLARRAAGKKEARWSFRTIFERSGSAGTFAKFCFTLRKLVVINNLPEYDLREVAGKDGPNLIMTRRSGIKERRNS